MVGSFNLPAGFWAFRAYLICIFMSFYAMIQAF